MTRGRRQRLVLFFTRDVALSTWAGNGSLERERALYRRLAPEYEVTLVTYGGAEDAALARALPDLGVRWNRLRLPRRAYARLLPVLHARALTRADVLKTNQSNGGLAALRAKRLFRKPLIARCGFMWSLTVERQRGVGSPAALWALREERTLFRGADRVVVTTDAMRDYATRTHELPPDRVRVVPNSVDTELFRPSHAEPEPRSLVFVGRLSPEKNLTALLDAAAAANATVTLVGVGPLEDELREHAARAGVDARFAGTVANAALPELLGRHEAFVLPSLWEGHPKVVLEAMACGLAVVGSDAPGVRELIRDGEDGVVAGTAAADFAAAVEEVLADAALRRRLGGAARERAVREFSLDRVAALERDVLAEVAE